MTAVPEAQLQDDEGRRHARLLVVLLHQAVHLVLPHRLAVLLHVVEHGGEDGDQQVEQHHVADEKVDGQQDQRHVVVEAEVLAEGVLVADGLVERHHVLEVELAVHLPVGQEDDVVDEARDVLLLELLLGVEQGLAGGAVAEDKDDEEQHEGDNLWDHAVEDDELGPQLEAGVVHAEDAGVEQGRVHREQGPGDLEGAGDVLEDEAHNGDEINQKVQFVPHTREVIPQLCRDGLGGLEVDLSALVHHQDQQPHVDDDLGGAVLPLEVEERHAGVEQQEHGVADEGADVLDDGSSVEHIDLLPGGQVPAVVAQGVELEGRCEDEQGAEYGERGQPGVDLDESSLPDCLDRVVARGVGNEGLQMAGVGNVEEAAVAEPGEPPIQQADGLVPVLGVGQLHDAVGAVQVILLQCPEPAGR